MLGRIYLDDVRERFLKLRKLADGAVVQVLHYRMFDAPASEVNSIAATMKHIAGNMTSRWTDFLNGDGEKPTRDRDSEFESSDDRPEEIEKRWQAGWRVFSETLESLTPEDLERSVTIRGESHRVIQAINRQLDHYAYHVGQIVIVAKWIVGPEWKSLSIPRGASTAFNALMASRRGSR